MLFVTNDNNNTDYEKIKINPYNTNNKLITPDDVNKILFNNGIQYKINDLQHYILAFSHKSYCKKKSSEQKEDIEIAERPDNVLDLMEESNERLEFLGDSIISSVIADYLYKRYYNQDEGFLTRLRTKLVNGTSLGNFAKLIGLTDYVLISRHVEERCNGRDNLRILEDCFESFIGAVYLDFNNMELKDIIDINKGYNTTTTTQIFNYIDELKSKSKTKKDKLYLQEIENKLTEFNNIINNNNHLYKGFGYKVCQQLIINIIETHIDFTELILKDTNYKDRLLRYFQQNFQITPKYKEEENEGPPHCRIFTMSVSDLNDKVIGIGKGKSKKKAEQKASRNALIYFGEINDNLNEDNSDSD